MRQDEIHPREAVYEAFFEHSNEAFLLLCRESPGGDFPIHQANRAAVEMFGCRDAAQLVGKTVFDFSPTNQPDGEASTVKGFRYYDRSMADHPQHFDWTHVRPDGTSFDAQVSLRRTTLAGREYGIAVIRDVTSHKDAERNRVKLERQLRQSQKLEALGILAGGIAHDFNNILAIIVGNLDLALMGLDDQPHTKTAEELHTALTASMRATDLVRQILSFSRRGSSTREPVAVRPLVRECAKMLRSTLPSSIEIETHLHSDAMVRANAIELHQVVMNLCTNASHALGDEPGTLRLALQEAPKGPEGQRTLVLTVEDDGHGMSDDVRNKAFDPFFTTKPVGEGTGMGLSVVHGIVHDVGGTVELHSEVGHGTQVRVQLPICEPAATATTHAHPSPPRGSERILVVDDERDVGSYVCGVLREAGYDVLFARNGDDALRLIKAHATSLRLVFSDLAMPGMTALDLAATVQQMRPDLAMIIHSGLLSEAVKRKAETLGVDRVLAKPLRAAKLLHEVRNVLDERKP